MKPADSAPAFGPPPPPPTFNPPPPPAFQFPPPPAFQPPPPAFQPPPPAYAPPAAFQPPPQYAPPPPAFAPPPAMPMGYGQVAAPRPMAAGPMPPSMHWVVVWLLGGITFGLFTLIWCFKQAGFVKKIDPSSKAVLLMTLTVVAQVVLALGCAAVYLAASSESSGAAGIAVMVVMLLSLAIVVFWLIAIFGIRSSLVRYYNTVEPMGLRLSGAMTFFFNILYFQYHLTRIANWKKTGALG